MTWRGFGTLIGTLFPIVTASATPASQTTLSEHGIAVVMQDPKAAITKLDIVKRAILIRETSGLSKDTETFKSLMDQAKRSLIDEGIQYWVSTQSGVTVSDAEVKEALSNVATDNGMTLEHFTNLLNQSHIPNEVALLFQKSTNIVESFKQRLRSQIAWSKFIKGQYASAVTIHDREIQTYLNELKHNLSEKRFEVFEIFLRVSEEKDRSNVRRDIENLHRQLQQGAFFHALAQQFSQSTSSLRGGYLGWFSEKNLNASIRASVQDLGPGEFSKPIEIPGGFKIIWIRDVQFPGEAPSDHVTFDITQIWFPNDAQDLEEEFRFSEIRKKLESLKTATELLNFAKEHRFPHETFQKVPWSELQTRYHHSRIEAGTSLNPLPTEKGTIYRIVSRKYVSPMRFPSKEDVRKILESRELERFAAVMLRRVRGMFYTDDRTTP